jgi:ABC-type amino acid transport substrate-binding protein
VYNDFSPYSKAGKGIDVELARAIAGKLGLSPEIVGFNADEDMNDDLRNMVWKGHYLGTQPADLMMHVPVDTHLAKANDKVRIFGAYHRESLGVARDTARIQPLSGSAAVALEVFTREKIGVETATLADSFLLGVLNGRLRENVIHFKTVADAAKALQGGVVAAVLAPRSELEAALAGQSKFPVESADLSELKVGGWPLGMAVKVEENELADAIAAALADLKREGVVAEIFKRHGITYQAA